MGFNSAFKVLTTNVLFVSQLSGQIFIADFNWKVFVRFRDTASDG